jgi:hypothetical protein
MLLPVYGKSATPVDLFESNGMPRLYELDCGTHRMLGVFNWIDEPATVSVPLPEDDTHIFEVWERRYLGVRNGSLDVVLPAHGCALLRLTPALDRPQVVGTTFHVLQGAIEVAEEAWDDPALRLRVRPVAKADGELFVVVPHGSGEPVAENATIRDGGGGVLAVGLRVEDEIEVVVRM